MLDNPPLKFAICLTSVDTATMPFEWDIRIPIWPITILIHPAYKIDSLNTIYCYQSTQIVGLIHPYILHQQLHNVQF